MVISMADRSVRVKLSAQVQGYMDAMEQAAQKTREAGSEMEKLEQHRRAFEMLGASAMVMGTAAAAGVGLAVAKWADFDQAMSAVQAATGESEGSMEKLSQAALDAGARTVYSAEEAANAIEELAKAGVSTADILNGGLDGALDLAAAGGLGVADAAGIAAVALKTFNLNGQDMAHVADLLAAGAGKAMGDVSDLSMALNQSSMVAHATGLSIEETTGALSAFASQGLLGSDAGTSFKSMLQSLTPTSKEAERTMKELGISAYDQQGNFVGLAKFAGILQNGLKDLTVEQQQAALKTIFGSDAIRAATVLYSEGEAGIQKWINAVNDQGFAAEQARARLDNLKGDLEGLSGALDTALIQTGSAANDTLRAMVQWVTAAVDAYNDLPAPLQGVTLAAGVLTAGVALLGGGLLVGVTKVAAFKEALATLEITSARAGAAVSGIIRFLGGPWGVALTAAAMVTSLLVSENAKLSQQSQELADTLDSATGAITENSQAWAANQLQSEGVLSRAKRLGISAKDMTDAWLGNADALERVNGQLDRWTRDSDFRMENADWKEWSDDLATVRYALDGSNTVLKEAKDRHDELREATQGSGDAAEGAAGAAGNQADALAGLGAEAGDTKSAVSELADEIRNFGQQSFDVDQSAIQLQDSFAKLKEILDGGAGSLDITTKAGRDTSSALLDLAKNANESAAATYEATGSQEQANKILEEARGKITDARVALGEDRAEAQKWANTKIISVKEVTAAVNNHAAAIRGIPPDKLTKLMVDRGFSQQQINNHIAALKSIDGSITTVLNVVQETFKVPGQKKADGGLVAYADGGMFQHASGGIAEFANGGINPGIYSAGPPIIKFAEPETRWEAFISGKPGKEARNREVWVEAGRRLGVDATPSVTNNYDWTINLQSTGNTQSDIELIDRELRARRARGGF